MNRMSRQNPEDLRDSEWNRSVWYYNGGCNSLHPWNEQHQEWTPNVNYGLWVMTCQHRSIDFTTNNASLWWGMLIMREDVRVLGQGHLGHSGPSAQRCCEPKTALGNKLSWKAENLHLCAVINHSVVSDFLQPCGLLCPWNSPGKNVEVGGHAFLQGIFLTQRSNPDLPRCRQIVWAQIGQY